MCFCVTRYKTFSIDVFVDCTWKTKVIFFIMGVLLLVFILLTSMCWRLTWILQTSCEGRKRWHGYISPTYNRASATPFCSKIDTSRLDQTEHNTQLFPCQTRCSSYNESKEHINQRKWVKSIWTCVHLLFYITVIGV